MLCQRCKKKEATVHLTKIINGEKTEVYLCEECAKESGQISFNGNDPFSFQKLLSGILNPEVSSYGKTVSNLKCENCGMMYKEFSKNGLFGCAECYQAFSDRLKPLFKRIHGNLNHNGKIPRRKGGKLRVKKKITDLRKEMEEAVENENFERAAEIRDKIRELEKNDLKKNDKEKRGE